MPRNQKESQGREVEDEERELGDAPRVDEDDAKDEEEWAPQSRRNNNEVEDEEAEGVDEDDIAEEIDLDDLAAMEGPDA